MVPSRRAPTSPAPARHVRRHAPPPPVRLCAARVDAAAADVLAVRQPRELGAVVGLGDGAAGMAFRDVCEARRADVIV
jgi:hypothetical protein